MNESQFETIVSDPVARQTNYQEMVRAYYERITDVYREKWGECFHFAVFSGSEPVEEAIVATERRLADEGHFRADMKILDVGCGVGGPALNLAEYTGAHVTGINIVSRQLEIARQRAAERGLAARTNFVLGDGMYMEFPDASFDAVYLFEAGCHMPDKPTFYRECARVLRPGGAFVGQDWFTKDGPSPQEVDQFIEPICRLFSLPNMISLIDLERQLAAAGLAGERCQNMAEHGEIMRNWELLDGHVVRAVHGWLPWLIPSTLRLLTDGGMALSKAARAGAFVIGQWCARKPAREETR